MNLGELLESSGAILRGHFLLTSGRHSDVYFEKFRVLERPEVLSALCKEIAENFADAGIEVVAGPTTGGIIIAFEVARQMGLPSLYVETEDGQKKLRRGAVVKPDAKILVVDDVLTTGLSIKETVATLEALGGDVRAVGVLIDRSPDGLDLGKPMFASYKVTAETFAPDEVPDWLASVPVTKPGTRLEINS